MIIPSPNPALTPISQPTMKSEEATHLLLVPNRLKIPNPLADHSTQFCIQPANVVQLGLGGKPVNRLVCLHFASLFVRISPLVISVMIYMMNPSGFYGFLLTKHGRYLFDLPREIGRERIRPKWKCKDAEARKIYSAARLHPEDDCTDITAYGTASYSRDALSSTPPSPNCIFPSSIPLSPERSSFVNYNIRVRRLLLTDISPFIIIHDRDT